MFTRVFDLSPGGNTRGAASPRCLVDRGTSIAIVYRNVFRG